VCVCQSRASGEGSLLCACAHVSVRRAAVGTAGRHYCMLLCVSAHAHSFAASLTAAMLDITRQTMNNRGCKVLLQDVP
jgi:hypothetical protein